MANCSGEDRGVVAERRGQHARAEDDALGAFADRGQAGQRVGGVAADVAPRLEVVGDHHGVEADLLGEDPELDEVARPELLGGGLVADLEGHQPTSRVRVGEGAVVTGP